MMQDAQQMKAVMAELIAKELRRLAAVADVVVYTLYDPENPEEPIDSVLIDREELGGSIKLDVSFDFEGVALWYVCRRNEETFTAKKVLIQIRDGRFAHGQVGEFDGYWEEFGQYVTEDRWVQSTMIKGARNDDDLAARRMAAAAAE